MNDALTAIYCWIGANAAAIIALCALFVATYQVVATRRHNRLSVRPHIEVTPNRTLDTLGRFAVTLRNNGLGPAIIESYEVTLDDKPIPLAESSVAEGMIAGLIKKPLQQFSYFRILSNMAIAKDQEVVLLSITFGILSREEYDATIKLLDRLGARIKYRSMYREPFVYDSSERH